MANVGRRKRAGPQVALGRRRADAIATRLGVALKDSRRITGMRQQDVADAAGISQSRVGELERGLGGGASLETWALAAAAVGQKLVAYLETAPGATPPRDIEHLRRQASVIDFARGGGWEAHPELALDPGAVRSRSADVVLIRRHRREAVLVEIWDWFDDVGASFRSLDAKAAALGRRLEIEEPAPSTWTTRSLFVVRRTRRNIRLVAELRSLFLARFPGSSSIWLRALSVQRVAPPRGDGFVWSTAALKLRASRLGRGGRTTSAIPSTWVA